MYGKYVLQQLQNNTTIPFAHFGWSKAPEQSATITAYGILSEKKIHKKCFDDTGSEQAISISIDVYLYTDEMDECKAEVETVLDGLQIAYSFSIDFSAEAKLIHLSWTIDSVYGGDT